MTPLAIKRGFVKQEHLRLLEAVRTTVDAVLPDGLTCHEACRQVADFLTPGLRHVQGKFNHWDHSWLEIEGTRLIIDAYPWACASGPILVDLQTGSPWSGLYREKK